LLTDSYCLLLSVVAGTFMAMTAGSEVTFTHPVVGAVSAANGSLKSIHDAAYFGLSDADLESALEGCEQLRARVFDATLGLAAEADERDTSDGDSARRPPRPGCGTVIGCVPAMPAG
jgi:hypothetical protein